MSQAALLIGAAGSGVALSAIGIAYRLGQTHRVPAAHVALCLGAGGTLYFGIRALTSPMGQAPVLVWVLGVLAGISQYVTVRIIQAALKRGPLMPVWCAIGITFVLPVMCAACFLNESLDAWQMLGLGAGALTVVAASLNANPAERSAGASADRRTRDILLYGVLLIAVLAANGVNLIAIKLLGHTGAPGPGMMATYGNLYFALLYSGLGGLLFLHLLITRTLLATSRYVLVAGPMAAAGSVAGMALLGILVPQMPAAALFTTSSSTSILGAALVSALFLGERTRPAWYMTIAFSILTILLVNMSMF